MPTEFGLFPTNISPVAVVETLAAGAQQGVQNFVADLSEPSALSPSLPSLSDILPSLGTLAAAASPTSLLSAPTDIVNTLTSVAATDFAAILPTADLGLALVTTLPLYDASKLA